MGGDDGPFRLLLDRRRRHDLFGDHNQATGGLGLFLVLPARAVDPAIALGVRDLHMHERDFGRERRHRHVGLAREGTGHPRDLVLGAALLQAVENLGGQQRLDRDEGKPKRAREIAEAEREAGPVLEGDRAGLARAVDAVDRPEPVERSAADDQPLHQAGADEQVRVEARRRPGKRSGCACSAGSIHARPRSRRGQWQSRPARYARRRECCRPPGPPS